MNDDDFVFTIGKGRITLKDIIDTDIRVEDTNGDITTYCSGYENYYIASTVEEPWFAVSDNVSTNEIGDITNITTSNYSADNLNTTENLTELAPINQPISYSKDDK